jgi:hypothetical protein
MNEMIKVAEDEDNCAIYIQKTFLPMFDTGTNRFYVIHKGFFIGCFFVQADALEFAIYLSRRQFFKNIIKKQKIWQRVLTWLFS